MGKPTGSSGKYLEIDLGATEPPFTFEEAFRAAYPNTGRQSFVSREILALAGGGTMVMRDAEGDDVTVTIEELNSRAVEFVGVVSTSGVSRIAVYL
jgi:hypothetical protein